MTFKECAKKYAQEIKENPTREHISVVVQKIQNLTVKEGRKVNDAEIDKIISYMDEELDDFYCFMESFENQAQLTAMQAVHELIDKARKENKNG